MLEHATAQQQPTSMCNKQKKAKVYVGWKKSMRSINETLKCLKQTSERHENKKFLYMFISMISCPAFELHVVCGEWIMGSICG
jgi:hypothetical protein